MTTASIPLTKGRVAIVDTADYTAILAVGRWSYAKNGYAVHYYLDGTGHRKTLYMHRLIMQRSLGSLIPPGLQVDHINLERLDNTRDNLRLATRSQNQAHKSTPTNNTSQYKGVSWNHGKWEARIKYGNRRIHLGRFEDAIIAAIMYDAASRRLYQQFAGCNFPDLLTPSHIEEQLHAILKRYDLA